MWKNKNIREVFGVTIKGKSWFNGDGYEITTEDNTICLLIENGQHCCERWGYATSNDNFAFFIGSYLQEIRMTDTALKSKQIEFNELIKDSENEWSEMNIQFVDFITSKGIIQFAVYNAHNGYYGHDVFLLIDGDIDFEDRL